MKKKSKTPGETQKLGRLFLKEIKKFPCLILLNGPLGAGKTHFAQGFIHGFLKKEAVVTSPSYSLVNAYRAGKKSLFHVDLYRLQNADDLESLGFWDFFEGPNIILVEWAEKLPAVWPDGVLTYEVNIKINSETERELIIRPFSKES